MRKLLIAIFIFPVKVYQYAISPMLGANCRYSPTCSSYTVQAIKEWGPLRGSWMGLRRFSRCHPWGGHGYDPVPKREGQRWF
ncbi:MULTISPECIES: membrane protein insertion efficiency factor YidD [Roseivirga]|uniref:membrane protein insertion efficiency factor YidD n=1 Tax=Roseivirga TaxID=290180 RepID=UPI00167392B1|nr:MULTISPECIES: membrane protein insertion efficiency factor YidD [Roseivirga]